MRKDSLPAWASRGAARCDAVASSSLRSCLAQQAFERLRFALLLVDRLRLRAVLITVSTRQRFSSSSSRSMAVVVRKIITGPSTRYSCVTSVPLAGSLPVLAMVSTPSDCSSFSA